MKLCCDENVKASIVTLLEQEGYDLERVQDVDLGTDDPSVVDHCRETDRVLLTNDDDFFAFDDHPGIFFLDEQTTPARDVVTAVQRIAQHVDRDEFADRVWHVPNGWV
ncbi:DUF5615 family PIN-like protein [Halovivax sp.]|uniref:DUF5615 family PIN-like protein n=1 Tax=Halovivax sp. TaxID=1935978 RepID=UPI0025B8EF99|nr:DUF5615 family PIN-like protein [Halovivax sp.]